MKAVLWKLIRQWRDATTAEAAWIARDQIDIELDKIEAAATQEPVMWAYQYADGTWRDASSTEHSAGMKGLYAAAGAAPTDEWKDAVLNALASHAMDAPLTDTPREIVKKLMDMVVTMARDPAINAGAAPVQQEQASFPTKDAELWLTKNKLATHGVLGAAPAAKVPEDAP